MAVVIFTNSFKRGGMHTKHENSITNSIKWLVMIENWVSQHCMIVEYRVSC